MKDVKDLLQNGFFTYSDTCYRDQKLRKTHFRSFSERKKRRTCSNTGVEFSIRM